MREKVRPAGLIAQYIKDRGGPDNPIIADINTGDVLRCMESLFAALDAAHSHADQKVDRGFLSTAVRRSFNERCLGWGHPDTDHPMHTVLMDPATIKHRRSTSRHRELMFTLLYEPLVLKLGLTYDDLVDAPIGFIEDLHQVIETYKRNEEERARKEAERRAIEDRIRNSNPGTT